MNIDMNLLKEFVALENRKKVTEADLNIINARIAEIEEPILNMLADNDIDQIKIDGRTVYSKSVLFAVFENKDLAAQALIDAGYKDMVKETFNTNSLSALLREFKNSGMPFPENFTGVIESREKDKLMSRKG